MYIYFKFINYYFVVLDISLKYDTIVLEACTCGAVLVGLYLRGLSSV